MTAEVSTPGTTFICPTCGQVATEANREAELLRLLKLPTPTMGRTDHRNTYLGRDGAWYITYRTPGPYRPFSRATVDALVQKGLLAPVYPGLEEEPSTYGLASYFGQPSYIADFRRRMAERPSRKAAQR